MESLSAYIPTDRRQALAHGAALPDSTSGAALFADISGFTPLTEALVEALGPQRGAEELTRWLNEIYDALLTEVGNYRGSVIGFGGDAITAWFDDQCPDYLSPHPESSSALRATAAALAIQRAMQRFAQVEIQGAGTVSLAMKAVVTVGPARRFLVGDPAIQLVDALAGQTLYRLASGEHQARRGEVLLDETAVARLEDLLDGLHWREAEAGRERFAVVERLRVEVPSTPWPPLAPEALSDERVQSWLLPPVYDRLKSGMGEFLTELRPTVAMFLRFAGIDYDNDPQAPARLNEYIQAVQRILARYDSYLFQLIIGDKGSNLYTCFGAPDAHEDDAIRSIAAALDLRDLQLDFIRDVQIGVSQGLTRTGACGGLHRRTYSAMGDAVNMAARLMQNAPIGQVLVNQNVRKATGETFAWEELPPLTVKGKSQPVTVFRPLARQGREGIRLHEPKYALPMVGRAAELALIEEKLNLALRGRGQIVGITAEAGMGKSRLVAEVIRLAREHNMPGLGGECQSYGTSISYLVWQSIWQHFFGLDPAGAPAEQVATLERQLAEIDPGLLPRLPLLGAVLNLQIPDNELTASFNAKLRKESLEALLVDCLRQRTRSLPLLLVLEDCHWLDPLSHDLLEAIGRVTADLPVLIVLAYRPAQLDRALALRVEPLFHFTGVPLQDLPAHEIQQLVAFKLSQVYGEATRLPQALIAKISERAQGNPFYIEELLNYLHDRNIDPQQPEALEQIDLPNSLYSLILSRIDQLTENQKTLLKVASVIGRLFQAAMLWGIYNEFGDQERLHRDLEALSALDLTPLDTPEPELAYLFKHILTREVAYETLPFATRAILHDQIGRYLELHFPDTLDQYVDLLAYHYERSENQPKKREYLLKAAKAAQANYANEAAIIYYRQVLHLLAEAERVGVMLELGQIFELVGQWENAEEINRDAESLAAGLGDLAGQAQAQRAMGWLFRKQGKYAEAEAWLIRSRDSYEQVDDKVGMAHVFGNIGELYRLQGKFDEARTYYGDSLNLAVQITNEQDRKAARAHAIKGAGTVATWQGDYATARGLNEESLALRRDLGDIPGVATLLNNLGIIARFQRDLPSAWEMNEESLALFRKMGDRWAVGQLLNNQACVASDRRQYAEARQLLEESLSIRRQLGDKAGLALSLITLADVVLDEGRASEARPLLDESLALSRELGDQTNLAYLFEDYSGLAVAEAQPAKALRLAAFAAALRKSIGAPLPQIEQARLNRMIAPAWQALPEAEAAAAWNAGRVMEMERAMELALSLA